MLHEQSLNLWLDVSTRHLKSAQPNSYGPARWAALAAGAQRTLAAPLRPASRPATRLGHAARAGAIRRPVWPQRGGAEEPTRRSGGGQRCGLGGTAGGAGGAAARIDAEHVGDEVLIRGARWSGA